MADAARRTRIFIGVPCYGMVPPEVLEDWMRFMFHLGRRQPQYDFFIGIRVKSEQFRARAAIVESAQQIGADWLLMLDDDMVINPFITLNQTDDYGFIDKLIAHDKDIVGALYFQRTGGCAPVAMMESGESGYRFLRDDELKHDLQQVDVTGGGALLVRMKVFDRLPHPYFAPEHEYGTDVQLCRAAKKKGITVWLDSSIELGHIKDERVIITSRNKDRYAMESSIPGDVTRQLVQSGVFNQLFEDAKQWTGYSTFEEMAREGSKFMKPEYKSQWHLRDWYNQFPKERVARQVWFNAGSGDKRQMTEFILSTVNDSIKADILDFGCGIGIPAFEFARRGHRVTALDLQGTGTLEFLKWRSKTHGVHMTFHESAGGVPHLGDAQFGAIVAMDCLEHIPEWKVVLAELASRLKKDGLLFCNNGVLDDPNHPEHIDLRPKEFVAECVKLDLMPFNPISFIKR